MNLLAFIITTLAGLSTLLGSLIIFVKFKDQKKVIANSLMFAAGVMLAVSLLELIPESILMIKNYFYIFPSIIISLIFIALGVYLAFFISKYIPLNDNNKLYKVGIISMIALMLHNIPEGIATFITSSIHLKLGITLSIAIALHNIPEGISIAIPIFYASKSRKKALLYTFIAGISELIGAIIAFLFLKPIINDLMMGILYAIIAGIMIHISIYELIPTSLKNNNKTSFISFIIGFILMIITSIVL